MSESGPALGARAGLAWEGLERSRRGGQPPQCPSARGPGVALSLEFPTAEGSPHGGARRWGEGLVLRVTGGGGAGAGCRPAASGQCRRG